jgi:hypothetical protein
MISYPGAKTPDPMTIDFDKTPRQAQLHTQLMEEDAKDDPEGYEKTTVNGYQVHHQRLEWADGNVIVTREDRYLITSKAKSSLLIVITSKQNDPELQPNYDASDKLSDFTAIVQSVKFLL